MRIEFNLSADFPLYGRDAAMSISVFLNIATHEGRVRMVRFAFMHSPADVRHRQATDEGLRQ